jgi:anti-sigma B factor antagonist
MALAESSAVTSHRGLVAFAERDAHRTVVWLQGEHDVTTVAALSETMARAIALDDSDLVIDLSGVDFMDAATIGVIVRARDFLAQRSRSMSLRSPSTCARRIIDVCDLADLLDADLLDPSPLAGARMTVATAALCRLAPAPTTDRTDAPHVAEGDLQQRARRGDAALLSLLRLDERKRAPRVPPAKNSAARLLSRASRSTRFARPI